MSSASFDGFKELEYELNSLIDKADNVVDVLEIGAKEFVEDLSKLPKPMSKITSSGYTHMIDTFSYRKRKNEIEVGWGKYYGRMVEEGTIMTKKQPHLNPIFESNKDKYYISMIKNIY